MAVPRTEEELREYLKRFAKGGAAKTEIDFAVLSPDLESASRHKPKNQNLGKTDHPRFRVHIHSKRRRLVDPDGLSVKAALDGLVRGKILCDDSADWIEEVTFSQEKSDIQETVIEIWQIEE